jgi:hypothetical protein
LTIKLQQKELANKEFAEKAQATFDGYVQAFRDLRAKHDAEKSAKDEKTREISDLNAKLVALTKENKDLREGKTAAESKAPNLTTDSGTVEEQVETFKSPSQLPGTSLFLKGKMCILHFSISCTRKKTMNS